MKGKLSRTDKEAIVAELQSGKATETELPMGYHISVSAISHQFKKIMGNIFKPANRLSQTDKETIVKELQLGNATIKDLATRYGVHPVTIGNSFKQMTGQPLHPLRLSRKDRKIIVEALQSGKTPKELATEYGVGSSYIGYIYKKATGTMLRKLPHQDVTLFQKPPAQEECNKSNE